MFYVSIIDQQHQKLVEMFNQLNDAVKNNEKREVVYPMIDDIISFTLLHFETEEGLMNQSEYPEFAAHKDKHKQLIQDALHLKEKLDYIGEQMFTDWFNHWPFARVLAHIQYADKQFESHLAQCDEKEPSPS